MSGYFFKAVSAVLLAVILAGLFKRDNGSFSLLLTIATGVLLLFLAAVMLQPVLNQIRLLADSAGFRDAYLMPILKCTGIGIVTQVAVCVAKDAGESSLAAIVELSGCILTIFLSLPLFEAVLQVITELMGG